MAELAKILARRRQMSEMASTVSSSASSPARSSPTRELPPEELKRQLKQTETERDFLAARIRDLEQRSLENARRHADSLFDAHLRASQVTHTPNSPSNQAAEESEDEHSGYEDDVEDEQGHASEEDVDAEGDMYGGFGFISRNKRASEGTGHHHGPHASGSGEATPVDRSKDVSEVESKGLVSSAVDWLLAFSGEKKKPEKAKTQKPAASRNSESKRAADSPKVTKTLQFGSTSQPNGAGRLATASDSVLSELRRALDLERQEAETQREYRIASEKKIAELEDKIEDLKVKLQHATSQASDSTTSRQAAESARSRMLAFLQAPAPADLPLTLHSKDIREKQGLRPDVGSAGAGVGLKVTERDAKGKYREISEVFNLAGDVILSLQAELVLSKKREETLNHQVNTDATTISELKQSVASLQSEQETLGSKLADLESSLQEKNGALKTAESELSASQKEVSKLREESQKQISSLESSVSDLQKDLRRAKENFKTASTALEKARKAQEQSEEEAKKERVRSEALAEQVDSQSSALRDLNSKLGSFEEALLNAQKSQNATDTLEADLEKSRKETAAMVTKFDESKRQIAALEAKLASTRKASKTELEQALRKARQTSEAALRTAEARATELESALRSAKFDAGQAEGKLQKSKALVADLKKELKAIEGKLQTASQRAESAAQRSRTFAIFLFLAILVAGGSLALPYLLTQH